MKLTPEVLDTLRRAIRAAGGAGAFARKCRIDAANISRYLNGKVRSVGDDNWNKLKPFLTPGASGIPESAATIANTPELRECIKDAMMNRGLRSADDLRRCIGYDSTRSIERLLSGKLNFFPDVLSAIFDELEIDPDDAPLAPAERELLAPRGIYRDDGAMLVRPIPVVDWANAAGHLSQLQSCDKPVYSRWDPETTETVPAPVGTRRDTQAFRVCGVSMEPTINDGDILFVEPAASPKDIPQNKIVVAKLADGADSPETVVCKRFSRKDGEITLASDNPAGRSWRVSERQLVWIGVVVRKICEL